MFSELKSLEYTIEIIRAMTNPDVNLPSTEIFRLISERAVVIPSLTYIQKLLPKLVRAGILVSSDTGYRLASPADEITVASVLDICEMPPKHSIIYPLCQSIKEAFTLTTVDELFGHQ